MANETEMPLPNLSDTDIAFISGEMAGEGPAQNRTASDLEQLFDVPVVVSAVLGSTMMAVGDLMALSPGSVLELDRRVGEAIDILVNNRLVARGEVVLVEERLGVTMTEIIKSER